MCEIDDNYMSGAFIQKQRLLIVQAIVQVYQNSLDGIVKLIT